MDNLTHSLVGLAAAKAGLERVSPGATALCIVAANAPDADIITLLGGQFTYLEHHRGITHSIVGTLGLALALPLLFYAGDRLRARLGGRPPRARFSGLLIASLLLSASHPLLDYTNNYGLRPLLPWNPRWVYGDLVFIFDPWIWLALGGACFLLTAQTIWRVRVWMLLASLLTIAVLLLPQRFGFASPLVLWALWAAALAALIILHRTGFAMRWGAHTASVALALVVAYWCMLALLHAHALRQAQAVAQNFAARDSESVLQVAAMPTFANPLEWVCLAETNRATHRFSIRIGERSVEGQPALYHLQSFENPRGDESRLVARAAAVDSRAQIFLNFARFPATRVQRGCIGETVVRLADLRFTQPDDERRGSFSLDVTIPAGAP